MCSMGIFDIIVIAIIVIGLVMGGLFLLNRWVAKKYSTQQNLIDKTKQTVSIYVIDKKKDYAKNINLPKAFFAKMPKIYNYLKLYFVQAKYGPKIVTLMCDKRIYNAIQVKKTVKVDISGLYIVSIKGMKSEYEIKQIQKEKKEKEKQMKIQEKNQKKA